METVGRFEFSRKDLVGHGAFAVVFKGRHREKHDWEVAVKCINKKNLAKSQTLLGKEIKILKELKHDNIVALLDFQETASSVFLVMEYCNGGDLADYLQSKGTLSEDTIRVFLQQIAGAMRVLQAKGIIHRDLKPQNILLSHPPGRKSHFNNTCVKIADFGFARHLQNNMMAATLCGSPMYMAPEVIMSQNYDAKADLWSIGTIVFQCLSGKAPFQASSPQDLRLFYEKNKTLTPNIPRETSAHLRQLLLGLLQRNHKERMDFDEFFSHPFLEASASMKKTTPAVSMTCLPSSASASSCSSSSTSHLASPPQSLAEGQQLRLKTLSSPTPEGATAGGGGGSSKTSSSCDADDFVIVPANFVAGELTSESKVLPDSLMGSSSLLTSAGGGCSQSKTPPPCSPSSCSGSPAPIRGTDFLSRHQPPAIPVPTQLHNYRRLEQNLQVARREAWPRDFSAHSGLSTPPHPTPPPPTLGFRRLSLGGARQAPLSPPAPAAAAAATGLGARLHSAPCLLECAGGGGRQKVKKQHSDPMPPPSGLLGLRPLHSSPRLSELMQRSPLPTILGSPSRAVPPFEFPRPPSSPNLLDLLTQQGLVGAPCGCRETGAKGFGRSLSAGRLSDVLLRAAFGPDRGSAENLTFDPAVPSGGSEVVFTVGSPPGGVTPPPGGRQRKHSGGSFMSLSPAGSLGSEAPPSPRYGFASAVAVTFEAPELPEETLMEQEHTDTVQSLRFTLDFARCLMEVAGARGGRPGAETPPPGAETPPPGSQVADQISSLSREWSHAEQLVLYLKSAELLSTALQTAMQRVQQGALYPSSTVKQVVKRLNELYKSSVASCRSLSGRLQRFFSRKHRLMDQIGRVTAERLLFSHTVQMVQAAALDEMFHQGEASTQRYHKALLLMEGLTQLLTEEDDIISVGKCKECIERRLTAIQSGLCV